MGESNRSSRAALIEGILLVGILLLIASIFIPNFSGDGPSKTSGIVNNLRQLDGAVQQWALDHGRTGTVVVTKEDIAPYFRQGWVTPVVGEHYTLKTLTDSPEAQLYRDLEGHPKGTVFRLGTNGVEFILPNQHLQPTPP